MNAGGKSGQTELAQKDRKRKKGGEGEGDGRKSSRGDAEARRISATKNAKGEKARKKRGGIVAGRKKWGSRVGKSLAVLASGTGTNPKGCQGGMVIDG